MKTKSLLYAAFLCFTTEVLALTLPEGIEIEPPSSLDITYQVIPFYDAQEKVLASWKGDELQFYVTFEALPPQYVDPDAYSQALVKDLKKVWGSVDVGRQATYPGVQGFNGTALELGKPATGNGKPIRMVMHFITDGKRSYIAFATAVADATVTQDQLLQESAELLHTVHSTPVGKPVPERTYEGAEMIGDWVIQEEQPDGRLLIARIRLNSDGSFANKVSFNGKQIFDSSGVWHRKGNALYWTYLYSVPELQQSLREDMDEILSAKDDQVVVKSSLSGKQRVMMRVSH